MDTIGTRAYKEISKRAFKKGIAPYKQAEEIKVSSTMLTTWHRGKLNPSGRVLQKMALAGYDVMYILTGERKDNG